MNKITEAMPVVPEIKKSYTLKVLFGPMFGCELNLPADDYFILINQSIAVDGASDAVISSGEHAAAYTHNTLYIPCDRPSPNLILRLSAPAENCEGPGSFRVEVQDENKSFPATVNENEIFTREHIRFALKRSEDEWQESVRNFSIPPNVDAEFNGQETVAEFNAKKHHALIVGATIMLVLMITAAVIWYKKLESDRQVLNLNEALAGAPAAIDIYRGRENSTIYVLASKYQALEWVKEALFKLGENNNIIPLWLVQHQKATVEVLIKSGYPVVQIDYTKPQHPVIILWQDLSPIQREQLTSLALQEIPFALDIKVFRKSKQQLLQDARQGLDRMHINYRQINSPSGYALVIRDALSDNALSALLRFINNFNRQWGTHIINFPINLNENWLENKSYLESSNGYLFLNPRHWYFPLKQGDING
ncbi:type III secretion system protein (plasmid) [Pantoea stewartii subsp. stewartii DC283]|uniref:Type III secretion system effector protein n=3 Tax=Pantoea stewartii TaxID=66269 RepID=H3RKZ5_PANSE|nr:type III secretion system protein [Pantoea stewartii subsp. stewartii DC283]EHT97990.1 type III secretion system effector protein [Pantoea stewartii subsp. stewartii DC283]